VCVRVFLCGCDSAAQWQRECALNAECIVNVCVCVCVCDSVVASPAQWPSVFPVCYTEQVPRDLGFEMDEEKKAKAAAAAERKRRSRAGRKNSQVEWSAAPCPSCSHCWNGESPRMLSCCSCSCSAKSLCLIEQFRFAE
jgi:hypothetical protein